MLNHTVFLTLQNLVFLAFAMLLAGYLLTGPRAARIAGIVLIGLLYLVWDPSKGFSILVPIAVALFIFEILAYIWGKLREKVVQLARRRAHFAISIALGVGIGIIPFLDYFIPG